MGLLIYAVAAVGQLHLPVLQVFAWAGMLVSYSQDAAFATAVEMTFDGDHPCPMCKAIQAARQAQNPEAFDALPTPPLVMMLEAVPAWVHPPCPVFFLAEAGSILSRSFPQLETPPPRSATV